MEEPQAQEEALGSLGFLMLGTAENGETVEQIYSYEEAVNIFGEEYVMKCLMRQPLDEAQIITDPEELDQMTDEIGNNTTIYEVVGDGEVPRHPVFNFNPPEEYTKREIYEENDDASTQYPDSEDDVRTGRSMDIIEQEQEHHILEYFIAEQTEDVKIPLDELQISDSGCKVMLIKSSANDSTTLDQLVSQGDVSNKGIHGTQVEGPQKVKCNCLLEECNGTHYIHNLPFKNKLKLHLII